MNYEEQAVHLLAAFQSGEEDAVSRFKWEHPRFRVVAFDDVRNATVDLEDAKLVVARLQSFESWPALMQFLDVVAEGGSAARFEAAVDALVSGDIETLREMLREDPSLVHARSTRRHHATLLHYVGANGVEGFRQKTPPNAIAITKLLLDAGAEVDALADLYESKCTTMSMLVSSCHPANAGLQAALAELLIDYGAAFDGPGSNWQSSVLTALSFGYRDTAEALVRRGAPIHDLAVAAGLGDVEQATRLLPTADADARHKALALAAQHGHAEVVRMLLDAGEDPNRYNPVGHHAHSTPLHQAVWAERMDVVRLLVERGARLDIRDTIYRATPLEWAEYGEKKEIAEFLRDYLHIN